MNISFKSNYELKAFGSLPNGTVFQHNLDVFMKTPFAKNSNNVISCVLLTDGGLTHFAYATLVKPLNGAVLMLHRQE